MNKKLGIVVPVYNVEDYLECCIESIICQTYTDWELVLVNDASTDKSGSICDKYAEVDKRIRVLHLEKNSGPIRARYEGVKYLDTNYVTFMDADDWLENSIYQKMMNKIVEHDVDMVSTRKVIRFYAKDDNRLDCDLLQEGFYCKKEIKSKIVPIMLWEEKHASAAMNPSLWMKVFKRRLLLKQYERLKEYTFHYAEDVAIVYPYVLESENMYILDECGYYHRQRERNEVPSYIKNENFYKGLLDLYEYLRLCFSTYEEFEILMKQLNLFYIYAVNLKKRLYTQGDVNIRHLFPFHRVQKNSSIVLYGAGTIGKSYYAQIKKLNYCREVLWVDREYKKYGSRCVKPIEEIFLKEYECVVIAIMSEETNRKVEQFLVEHGVGKEKIILYSS